MKPSQLRIFANEQRNVAHVQQRMLEQLLENNIRAGVVLLSVERSRNAALAAADAADELAKHFEEIDAQLRNRVSP